MAAFLVTGPIEGRQNLAANLRRLVKNGIDQVAAELFETRQGSKAVAVVEFIKNKAHVAQWGLVAGHDAYSFAVAAAPHGQGAAIAASGVRRPVSS
jgi:hypothetical protein